MNLREHISRFSQLTMTICAGIVLGCSLNDPYVRASSLARYDEVQLMVHPAIQYAAIAVGIGLVGWIFSEKKKGLWSWISAAISVAIVAVALLRIYPPPTYMG
jgi:hypothetical protein